MSRRETLLTTGIEDAIASVEAASQSARILRNNAVPFTEAKATYRFVTEMLDEASRVLRDAEANLADLKAGARRAN